MPAAGQQERRHEVLPEQLGRLRWDQVVALALVVYGVVEFPRVCFCLAVSFLSWDTILPLCAILGIYPFLDRVVAPMARQVLLEICKVLKCWR
ncbi:hypothetical protein Cob_v006882 [Colletotrichum orbiculare MAFF 240422]|uniref:Uncharacterized protein n=1 Tax=Colletotrichum orbiculare (strain 104-T / ATCC 96160 / CBS 514.97 / LARS 414 / MAFF 240422) TaxID=1213857 RepID=A0A484FRD0_COLOR|nr:hypothetical protein Cob_v006882 [Colletotrichum orbiculare MAFF 240422]